MAGHYCEDLVVGQVFRHDIRRASLHLDEEPCRTRTAFEQLIVDRALTLGTAAATSPAPHPIEDR